MHPNEAKGGKPGQSYCSKGSHWVSTSVMHSNRLCIKCTQNVKDNDHKIPSGIYFIWYKMLLIYIGNSHQPNKRYREHIGKFTCFSAVKNKSQIARDLYSGILDIDHIRFEVVEYIDDETERKLREEELIREHQPAYNILKNPHYKGIGFNGVDYSLIDHLVENKDIFPLDRKGKEKARGGMAPPQLKLKLL